LYLALSQLIAKVVHTEQTYAKHVKVPHQNQHGNSGLHLFSDVSQVTMVSRNGMAQNIDKPFLELMMMSVYIDQDQHFTMV